MKPSVEVFSRWAVLAVVLAACSGAPGPEAASPAPAAMQPARPEPPRAPPPANPLSGLTPCAKDAPEGEGCSAKAATPAPSRGGKKIDDVVWRVPVEKEDPIKGPRDALVTLVVFSDFECPFCRNGAAVLESLLAEYPRDVRLVWKDLPLPMHAEAERAAELARVARARLGDEGFWKAHALLYESQATLGDATYERIASQLGVPWAAARAAIKNARHGAVIREAVALSDRVDVPATPTTFVNGRKVVGAQPYAVFKTVVDEELEKAKALVNRGLSRPEIYAAIVSGGKVVESPGDLPATR